MGDSCESKEEGPRDWVYKEGVPAGKRRKGRLGAGFGKGSSGDILIEAEHSLEEYVRVGTIP